MDKGGANLLGPAGYVKAFINYYAKTDDYNRLLPLYRRLIILEPKNSENWIKIAALYKRVGKIDDAINAAHKAGEVDAKIAPYVDEFIFSLENE